MRTTGIACLALLLLAAPPVAAAEREPALETTRTLVETAHTALTGEERPREARMADLEAAIEDAFAFDLWRRFLLDDLEARMSEAQKAEVEALLPGFLAHLYATQFSRGLDEEPTIGDVRAARRDLLVAVAFPRVNDKTLPTEWRIREFEGGEHRVIDVMVGGASFLRLKRDEFASIVERGGIEALIEHMRENSV